MRKKKKLLSLVLIAVLSTSLLGGCALDVSKAKDVLEEHGLIDAPAEPDYSAITDYSELDAEGEDFPSGEGFYIKHNDKYYPLGFPTWCDNDEFKEDGFGTQDTSEMVVSDIRFAMPNEYDTYLPTLYLDNKDSLVYYSETNVLDAYMFMKLWDLGYSVPITSFAETTAGYPYVSIDKQSEMEGEGVLLDCPARNEMLKQPVFQTDKDDDDAWAALRIFSVNGTDFTEDYIKNNVITGLTRNATYQFNGAFGSVDYQWSMDANYHYFMQGELYGEADYESSYNNLYTIPIPDYLKDGYYMLNDMTMFRLITSGSGYSLLDNEHFNDKSLGMDTDYAMKHGGYYDEQTDTYYFADDTTAVDDKHMYSSNEALNAYTTKVPGALGYKEEDSCTEQAEGHEGEKEKKNTEAIADMATAVYRIYPKTSGDSVKLNEETMVKVTSDITASDIPCTVSYYLKDSTVPITMTKDEKKQLYTYEAVVKGSITDESNAYLIIKYPQKAKVTITGIANGLSVENVQITSELPDAVYQSAKQGS